MNLFLAETGMESFFFVFGGLMVIFIVAFFVSAKKK
jgi:LPXTG-motif cell wall-anchored protein